jgi:hypothetical protein
VASINRKKDICANFLYFVVASANKNNQEGFMPRHHQFKPKENIITRDIPVILCKGGKDGNTHIFMPGMAYFSQACIDKIREEGGPDIQAAVDAVKEASAFQEWEPTPGQDYAQDTKDLFEKKYRQNAKARFGEALTTLYNILLQHNIHLPPVILKEELPFWTGCHTTRNAWKVWFLNSLRFMNWGPFKNLFKKGHEKWGCRDLNDNCEVDELRIKVNKAPNAEKREVRVKFLAKVLTLITSGGQILLLWGALLAMGLPVIIAASSLSVFFCCLYMKDKKTLEDRITRVLESSLRWKDGYYQGVSYSSVAFWLLYAFVFVALGFPIVLASIKLTQAASAGLRILGETSVRVYVAVAVVSGTVAAPAAAWSDKMGWTRNVPEPGKELQPERDLREAGLTLVKSSL